MNVPVALKQRIGNHVEMVRTFLSGLSASEQREILQSIEAHIYDALEARSNEEPTMEQLEAILAEMDPPESYGEPAMEVPRNKNHRKWAVVVSGMVMVALLVAGINMWSEKERSLIGRWVSVDFVKSIEQFSPETESWQGELYLKEITFLPNGKTDRPYWNWKDGILHHSGDNTDGRLVLRKIKGKEYLFLEWISGDVVNMGVPARYYVLKKEDPTTPRNLPLKPAVFEQGVITLSNGDSIILDEVMASSPDFAEGDVVQVKGRYTLSSQPSALLAMYVTATQGSGRSSVTKDQQMIVTRGTGEYALSLTIPYHGYLHLSFYDQPTGQALGGLYFGTKEQVEEIEELAKHWH